MKVLNRDSIDRTEHTDCCKEVRLHLLRDIGIIGFLQFVIAAKVLGFNDFRIITKHILPNIISPLIVISAANFAASILIESGLSFLGLGAQPPMTSWGLMIKDHYNYIILGEPFLAIIPGLCIMLLVCSFMILGNSLRDILDVKN